jgi:hypothetical protein
VAHDVETTPAPAADATAWFTPLPSRLPVPPLSSMTQTERLPRPIEPGRQVGDDATDPSRRRWLNPWTVGPVLVIAAFALGMALSPLAVSSLSRRHTAPALPSDVEAQAPPIAPPPVATVAAVAAPPTAELAPAVAAPPPAIEMFAGAPADAPDEVEAPAPRPAVTTPRTSVKTAAGKLRPLKKRAAKGKVEQKKDGSDDDATAGVVAAPAKAAAKAWVDPWAN